MISAQAMSSSPSVALPLPAVPPPELMFQFIRPLPSKCAFAYDQSASNIALSFM